MMGTVARLSRYAVPSSFLHLGKLAALIFGWCAMTRAFSMLKLGLGKIVALALRTATSCVIYCNSVAGQGPPGLTTSRLVGIRPGAPLF
jgi:hypothetical protein